jgi:two-component system, NarL family, sensor histidine kinase BarA
MILAMNKTRFTPDLNLVIDTELATKLAGNNPGLAEEIFELFLKNLPAEMEQIRIAKESNNIALLYKCVHKLHGAASYCGVPKLKMALLNFELALKNGEKKTLDSYYADLDFEVTKLLEQV